LKKALLDAARKGNGMINLADLGLGDVEDIADQMDHTDKQLNDMERTWEERLAEQRAKDDEERKLEERQE